MVTRSKAIGIDLGTTFSAVAVMEGGKAVIIPNAEGDRTTPSVVTVKDGEILAGKVARNQAIVNPENTVRSIKRHMGERDFKVEIEGKKYTPQEISAMILQKLKRDAEGYLGAKVKDAVVTVPAYFDDAQRQATKDAGEIAGLNVLRIINEPTSAALAYGLDKTEAHTILVFDFGGGTFDVSILELGDGVFEVKATSGDNHLGGDDIDDLVIDWIAGQFKKEQGIDLREDKVAHQRLKEAAERAKIELSSATKTKISLPFITADKSGPRHIDMEMTRSKLESLLEPILARLKTPVERALKDAGLTRDKIDRVIFVGGSTRIPSVQALVKELSGKDGDKSVNPDEAVALGAAIQAGILGGEIKDVLLLDVTPLTLGIETLGGVFTPLIERNTTIPTKSAKTFSTAADNQPAVTIHVLQGERPMAGDNKSLGRFDLVGIPAAPRGVPQIEVTFDIDANGIVNVSARDLGTGKEQKITISGSSRLDDKDLQRMRKEAEVHAEEDKQRVKDIEIMNQADTLLYTTEKSLKDFEGKVSPEDLGVLKERLEDLKKLLGEKKEPAEVEKAMNTLSEIAQKVATELYQKASQSQSGPKDSSSSDEGHKRKEKVVDAEVVKDKRKNGD